ncbi:MAG: hypothetical protein LBQ54_08950 [Planctomycetaceae bacterium]|nr:hypothetical protein [Planctomycetaceae bacterium]
MPSASKWKDFLYESDRLEEAGSKPGCNALALPPAAASQPAGGIFFLPIQKRFPIAVKLFSSIR